ncbi:cardiolipin synthase [Azomonas macrocytogenes]|uniref:Cardiolipin synthase A n=1 Tax=Azomonas macrocytogenes TaxID=69962 RepID=A0A839T3S5_AZOMA|nr:cardiolipin synthase [Azomonas macrocytogenes]MBB3103360.1 cardiolipin synthase [Azomonas macrocytogenes]
MVYDALYLFGYFMAVLQVCGLVAAIHAIFTVRTSQGAIAWAMSLVFMPLLTLLPYLVFGRSSFDGYIRARRQANEEMHKAMAELDWRPWVEEALAVTDSPDKPDLLWPFAQLAEMPSLASNQIRLLVNGEATFSAIFEAIAKAREVVLVQFFIIHDDELGRRLQAALLERAAAGVQIYLLYDAVGSHALPRHYSTRLRQAGVQVHDFSTRGGFINRFQLNFRNHRKIVVIDGQIGFVGGHNVGDEYLGHDPKLSPWRDTHIELSGPVLACLQESFAEDWYWATRQLPPLLLPAGYLEDQGVICQAICSGPADSMETASLFFVQALNLAQQRIWLTSPYFVPDEAVFAAMRLAVLRGVEVRLLLPSRPDHRMVYAASSLYALEAAQMGVRVFRYLPGFLHQKVVLIDDQMASVGSANLDNRSFRLNFEVTVLVADSNFADEVARMLEADFAESQELIPANMPKPRRLQQLGMRVARLVAPVL